MAEAIKSLRKISKKLEQTFQAITFYTAKHLARSKKYGSQYMEEFQRISRKMNKQQTNGRTKQNKKFKQQRDMLRKQLAQLKAKVQRKQRDQKDRKKSDKNYRDQSPQLQQQRKQNKEYSPQPKDRYRDRGANNYKDKRDVILNKKYEKQQQKYNNRSQLKKPNEKQRQIDFNRDFDFNKPYKGRKNLDNTIFQQEEQNKRAQKVNKVKKVTKWSDKKPNSIGSLDPQQYKILVVDEEGSDFQDDDAPLKVPQIKPRQPLTPYFLFLRANKHAISRSYPNVNSKRGYAKVWQELPQQQKKPFIDQYNRAQKIYANKLNQYYSINPQFPTDNLVSQQPKSKPIQNSKKQKQTPKKRQSKSKSKSAPKRKSKNHDSDYQN